MQKLNLGCGFDVKEGWLNTNHFSHEPVEGAVYLDAREEHLDAIDKFDFILVSHVLCTMKPSDADKVMANCHKWLKVGGKIELIDMDLLKVFASYQEGRVEDIPIEEGDIDDRLCFAISGYGTRLSLYTPERMEKVLTEAGFQTIMKKEESEFDTRPKESLIFEATK